LFAAAHRAIEARLKNRTIAAMLSVLIVVVPALLVTGRLVRSRRERRSDTSQAGVWRQLAGPRHGVQPMDRAASRSSCIRLDRLLAQTPSPFVRRSRRLLGFAHFLSSILLLKIGPRRSSAERSVAALEAETRRLFGRIVVRSRHDLQDQYVANARHRSLAQCFSDSISLPRFCGD
jgi:hypothetical protein